VNYNNQPTTFRLRSHASERTQQSKFQTLRRCEGHLVNISNSINRFL